MSKMSNKCKNRAALVVLITQMEHGELAGIVLLLRLKEKYPLLSPKKLFSAKKCQQAV